MKATDTKNNLIINKLIKKHWSLNYKSQKLFTHRLLYERDIPKEFSFVGEDLRYRVDLSDEELELLDESWVRFQKRFPSYVKEKNITYSNYLDNKVTVRKNDKKIVKDIVEYYKNKTFEIIDLPINTPPEQIEEGSNYINGTARDVDYTFDYVKQEFKRILMALIQEKGIISNSRDVRSFDFYTKEFQDRATIFPSGYGIYSNRHLLSYENDFSRDLIKLRLWNREYYIAISAALLLEGKKESIIKDLRKNFEKVLENHIRTKYQDVVQAKVFNSRDFQLVFTLNYADWFLASTGDSWSSCISLYSTYDECFWTGLAQLIGDKSRGMVYITKKGERKRYRKIVVDKFYFRSWVQLYRTIAPREIEDKTHYNKTFFYTLKSYPVETNVLDDVLKKILNLPSYQDIKEYMENNNVSYYKSRSRYYAENFWFKKNMNGYETMTTIYLDNGRYKMAKKNKAKYSYGDYGYYKLEDNAGANVFQRLNNNIVKNDEEFLSNGISFDEIIEERSSIIEQMDDFLDRREMYEHEEDWDEEEYA